LLRQSGVYIIGNQSVSRISSPELLV